MLSCIAWTCDAIVCPCISEIEAAARAGSLEARIDELLELIDDPCARVAHVAKTLSSNWTEDPEAIAADLYARTPELEGRRNAAVTSSCED